MTEYTPDSWVILKMINKDETYYKVLAGWASSYAYGSSWKLNSGITRVEEEGDGYLFHGHSGSVYRCHKDRYGLALATLGPYETMVKTFPAQVFLMEEQDWSEFDFNERPEQLLR